MKTLEVGCAIITALTGPNAGKILIARRKLDDHLGGLWEFPGGKKEDYESMEECLVREAMEELQVEIKPHQFLRRTDHTLPQRIIALHFYICHWVSGEPVAIDCLEFCWVTPPELKKFQFPEGDEDVINELIQSYFSKKI